MSIVRGNTRGGCRVLVTLCIGVMSVAACGRDAGGGLSAAPRGTTISSSPTVGPAVQSDTTSLPSNESDGPRERLSTTLPGANANLCMKLRQMSETLVYPLPSSGDDADRVFAQRLKPIMGELVDLVPAELRDDLGSINEAVQSSDSLIELGGKVDPAALERMESWMQKHCGGVGR